MKIICHRGNWSKQIEQNTLEAFRLALNNGFSIEIDVREMQKQLIISHDPPISTNFLALEEVFVLYRNIASHGSVIAINIKTDGIAKRLRKILQYYNIKNYFTFDMSVPEMWTYRSLGMRYFSRTSEFEKEMVFLDNARGVWLDSFEIDWLSYKLFDKIYSLGKKLCIVSSELHGRDHYKQWNLVNNYPLKERLMLCTDKPFEAREYFK